MDWLLWISLIGVVFFYTLHWVDPLGLTETVWVATLSHTVHSMMHAMWWGVVLGMVFVGLLSKVPREFIMSVLGRGGTVSGLLRATGAGVLLDLCNHGILMVAAKLYERGASAGQVIAFLLASPWNSFSLTLILIALIGWQWTLVFIVASMLVAWVTGWVFDTLVARGVLPENPNTTELPEGFSFLTEAKKGLAKTRFDGQFFKDVVVHGIKESRMVVRWLLVGVLLAGALRALLNPEQFEQYFGATLLGLVVTIFVATVLEVCSEGATPIAADIVTRAHAPGNAFAFLMAGVATDYTEIMVLKDTTKSWKFALFLPLITVPQILVVAVIMHMFG